MYFSLEHFFPEFENWPRKKQPEKHINFSYNNDFSFSFPFGFDPWGPRQAASQRVGGAPKEVPTLTVTSSCRRTGSLFPAFDGTSLEYMGLQT